MSICFDVERDIAREMLRCFPALVLKDGQVVIRSSRGMLVITSVSTSSISYSYVPSMNDIPTTETGEVSSLMNRIVDLGLYLLESGDGKIGHTPEIQTRRVGSSADRHRPRFMNAVPDGYGSYEMEDIINEGRGYTLSGGNTGNLLTSNTYDGGNEILTGGISGYRSNYGSNRPLGSIYGEYTYEEDINDVQDLTDTPETYLQTSEMYGGNDDDVDYIGEGNASMNANAFLAGENRTGGIDNTADIDRRMKRMSRSSTNATPTIRSVNALRGSNPDGNSFSIDASGINTVNIQDPAGRVRIRMPRSREDLSLYRNGAQVRFVNANLYDIPSNGVADTYNDAASDLGIGYGDLTPRGMNSTIGGNYITRNANLGSLEESRGMGMGLGGDG